MQIFNNLNEISAPFKNAAITIGNFDGVHLGHQALLTKTVECAQAKHGLAIAMTFSPHPVDFFHKKHRPYIITPLDEKLELMEKLGLDVVLNLPFTKELTEMTPYDFIVKCLLQKIGVKSIIMGKDYSFGKDRMGTVTTLQKYAPELGFDVVVVNWVNLLGNNVSQISSSAIREMIRHANMPAAAQMLGRPFRLQGPVVHGDDRGIKLLTIPTANLDITDQLYPPHGIYVGLAKIEDKCYQAAIYIGAPKTFNSDYVRVEAHLIDAPNNLDLYGKTIKIDFIKFLRDEIKFDNIEALRKQIIQDIDDVKQILRNANA